MRPDLPKNVVRSLRSKQYSITCFTVCLGCPHVHVAVTLGTLRSYRNAFNPVLSVRSCIAKELFAFVRPSCMLGGE